MPPATRWARAGYFRDASRWRFPKSPAGLQQQKGTEALEEFQVLMPSWISWVGKIELQSITLATLHEQCLHRKVETDTTEGRL